MILGAIADSNHQIAKEHKDNLKSEFIDPKEDIFITADKGRINQVISNPLCNVIKFTNEGNGITDTGPSIDFKILPKLFTKFATKSTTGSGLHIKKHNRSSWWQDMGKK